MDASEKPEEIQSLPTQEQLRELFFYDFQTGSLIRRKCLPNIRSNKITNQHLIGRICTTPSTGGYLVTSVRKKLYVAHRLIWAYVHGVWPKNDIDHINGNRADNRIENLREATRAENLQNRTVRNKNNTSGYPGVYWCKNKQKWCVEIKINRKKISLGNYDSKEDAVCARITGKKKYHTFDSTERSAKSA